VAIRPVELRDLREQPMSSPVRQYKQPSKAETAVGIGLNTVALAGGVSGLSQATDHFRRRVFNIPIDARSTEEKAAARLAKVPSKPLKAAVRPILEHPRGAAIGLAGGAMGLHATELVGDVLARRSFRRQQQANKDSVGKALTPFASVAPKDKHIFPTKPKKVGVQGAGLASKPTSVASNPQSQNGQVLKGFVMSDLGNETPFGSRSLAAEDVSKGMLGVALAGAKSLRGGANIIGRQLRSEGGAKTVGNQLAQGFRGRTAGMSRNAEMGEKLGQRVQGVNPRSPFPTHAGPTSPMRSPIMPAFRIGYRAPEIAGAAGLGLGAGALGEAHGRHVSKAAMGPRTAARAQELAGKLAGRRAFTPKEKTVLAGKQHRAQGLVERSHETAEQSADWRKFGGEQDREDRGFNKARNFVERFDWDQKTGARRKAIPGYKTSPPRQRALTGDNKTYLGMPNNPGTGTRQGLGAGRGGETVDYEYTGNRRVRKSTDRDRRAGKGFQQLGAAELAAAPVAGGAGAVGLHSMKRNIGQQKHWEEASTHMNGEAKINALVNSSKHELKAYKMAQLGGRGTAIGAGLAAFGATDLAIGHHLKNRGRKPVAKGMKPIRNVGAPFLRRYAGRNNPVKVTEIMARSKGNLALRAHDATHGLNPSGDALQRSNPFLPGATHQRGKLVMDMNGAAGRNADRAVSKAERRFDAESDRQRRVGISAGAGVAGGAGLGYAAHHHLKGSGAINYDKGRLLLNGRKAAGTHRGRIGLGLAAGSAIASSAGIGAYSYGTSERNRRWN
jgi:hypothetical protein